MKRPSRPTTARPDAGAAPNRPITTAERLAARWHRCIGMVLGRLGSRRRATDRLERALELDAEDFDSQIRLGWIAFQHGDYARWRRCMQRARTLSPVRFRSERRRYRFAELRTAGALPDQGPRGIGAADAVLFETRLPGLDSNPRSADPRPDTGSCQPVTGQSFRSPLDPLSSRHGDDFRDEGERERFRPRRAIAPDEIEACDFDRLIRRLGRLRDRRRDLH